MSATPSGFRKTAKPTNSFNAEPRDAKTANAKSISTSRPACSTPVTQQIIDELTHGRTPRMVADKLGLPLDFVNLAIERERRAGRLDIYDLRSCNSTTGDGCNPDPKSLVCAGCPILPAAIRRRQSLFGRLKAKLHR
ncbi:hypothetical protein [Bifidobacterium sp. ESL0764]|uniref:hypothetical protein n=1 Tax=Bifidobacterium sp. ESL0764 TaxID=2983228 RepID=UPI0023F911B4|nr:hypothetical protein [Bifidobacterium sp. ESL0764]WEV65816.1 hypothetical protein OZX71_00090 [Bifidobacterium sp. ESL0764]